ncbi:MAG: hypothetical protein NT154_04505 [Verrucomicrobia bacterium]|nr:hypothetical protein [Verrucomicrobiota bacterium]
MGTRAAFTAPDSAKRITLKNSPPDFRRIGQNRSLVAPLAKNRKDVHPKAATGLRPLISLPNQGCSLRRAAGIVTLVFNRADGSELFRVDFPHNEFACIERAINEMGITLERFFNDVMQSNHRAMECFAHTFRAIADNDSAFLTTFTNLVAEVRKELKGSSRWACIVTT